MLRGPPARALERFLRPGEARHVGRVRRSVVLDEEAGDGAEALGHRLVHGPRRAQHRLLRDRRDRKARRAPHAAVVRLRAALDQLQQARLARAVAADEAHALARLEDEVGMVEQGNVAVGEAGGGELDERHFGGDERSSRSFWHGAPSTARQTTLQCDFERLRGRSCRPFST
jgi:hypothetical protein